MRIHTSFIAAFCLVSLGALADQNHNGGGNATHTTHKIVDGTVVNERDNPYYFMRKIETDKYDCSGFDIGCGYVLTAGHCDTKDAKIKMGVNGDQEVGRVVETYTAPGFAIPGKNDGWVEGENANSDIKLLKVDYSLGGESGLNPRSAPERINWNLTPTTINRARPETGYVAGYGSTQAKWNEKKGHWEPLGPGGKLAAGRVPFSYAGYFTGSFGTDHMAQNFEAHRADKRGRICSEPTPGLQSIIQGDSGGPLLLPNGFFGGVTSSMWRSREPGKDTPNSPNYLSCFVDLAGHLPWIYSTMKKTCTTLPVVEALDKLNSPPGEREGARRVATAPAAPPLRLLEAPVAPRRPGNEIPPSLPQTLPPPNAAPAAPPEPRPQDAARTIHALIGDFRRQARDPNRLRLSDLDATKREQLRDSVSFLVQPPRHHQIGFGGPLRVGRDGTIEVPFAYCPRTQPLNKCDFVEAGYLRLTGTGVEVNLKDEPNRSRTVPLR